MRNRRKRIRSLLITVVILALAGAAWTIIGGLSKDKTDYSTLREVSWEGTELTISLGTNKSTGCEWTTKSSEDSVIDYSVNRVFHLSDQAAMDGEAIGRLDAGFEGKGPGTAQIVCTTPCSWDGTGPGYTHVVTVTVNEDGTIASADGK